MKKVALAFAGLLAVFAVACVTINVYFPEAAAEQAADRIIDKVRGEPTDESGAYLVAPVTPVEPLLVAAARQLLSFVIADANAQGTVDFDKPSPKKTALENSLANRFPQLEPFFDSGAIGVNETGTIEIRDRNLVPLKDRNSLLQLVNAQNSDWDALYAEIANLNGHPEWVDSIRRTFASRWVAKADAGWWYKEGGSWQQK
ncbi:MAG TPA: DUF1318 domain-containing protein [Woeseiaceae bacterium]|nr:DUF1318 domain-containing protein [Woeseiaceae bacterium]